MKVYFFTEFSRKIGYGHLSRCLSLAEIFLDNGFISVFFIRGFEKEKLNIDFQYEYLEWSNSEVLPPIPENSMIIFDTYQISSSHLDKIASKFKYVVSITDSKLNFSTKGIKIFGSVYAKNYEERIGKENLKNFLMGPKYMLFRKSFWNIKAKSISEEIKTITISLGAFSDPLNLEKIISLIRINFYQNKVQVLGNKTGHANCDQANVYYLDFLNQEELITVLRNSDLVISNGGQTLNETILLGVPVIAIEMAENQKLNVGSWATMGVLKNHLNINSDFFLQHFENSLMEAKIKEKRISRAEIGKEILDYKGAQRVFRKIKKDEIKTN